MNYKRNLVQRFRRGFSRLVHLRDSAKLHLRHDFSISRAKLESACLPFSLPEEPDISVPTRATFSKSKGTRSWSSITWAVAIAKPSHPQSSIRLTYAKRT